MRLQLILVAWLLSASSATGWAQGSEPWDGEAAARVLVYEDDDATTVVTSSVDAESALPGATSIGAHVLLDAVSSASVDVVSAATGRWEEDRVEAGARLKKSLLGNDVSVGFTRSQENDWLSRSYRVGLQRSLFQRNTDLSIAYGFIDNRVGRASDPTFERSIDSHSLELGASQLLDRKTRVGGSYTFQSLSGFLASPYRFVLASDGTRVAERHPSKRKRHAIGGYLLRSITDFLSLRASYRFYRDDWGLWSNTVAFRAAVEIVEGWSAGLQARYYRQNKANFYQSQYPMSFRYMTRDRELATFWDLGGRVDTSLSLGPATLDARIGVVHYRFRNFPALRRRLAVLAGGGVRVVW